ncbi:AbrB family transcriptional regulator [Paenibacillus sp. HB172176]|uniref:AbrB family transcriptional regulator n=1 Tax=Paenibacillus sp. HB172176 TaxID=2493690 RepID=UPI00143BE16E|nr:AbrB family transcriptional regulator [Paenibacillus sp. HB172176]
MTAIFGWLKINGAAFLFTAALAVVGGLLFEWIGIPIPWLLGPMILVLIGSKLTKSFQPCWPSELRNTGMIIVGYMIGLSFTANTFKEIGKQLPSMMLLTLLLLVCTYLIALLIAKLSGIAFPTILMGSIPGGLSQMIILAEELKGIDLTVVTFLQVSRLMMIIFFVPMLVFSPLVGASMGTELSDSAAAATAIAADWSAMFPHIWLYAAACPLLALIGNRIKFPTAFLLGPMVATIVIHLSGFAGPMLPPALVDVSQLLIGGYLGLMFKPEKLQNKLKIISLACLSGIILILCSLGLSLLLMHLRDTPLATSFLSLSPGAMDQMGIIAREVDADLSFVICYQLFRTLFIFLVVPPLLKFLFRSMLRRKEENQAA